VYPSLLKVIVQILFGFTCTRKYPVLSVSVLFQLLSIGTFQLAVPYHNGIHNLKMYCVYSYKIPVWRKLSLFLISFLLKKYSKQIILLLHNMQYPLLVIFLGGSQIKRVPEKFHTPFGKIN
jgi:hypothetical protein